MIKRWKTFIQETNTRAWEAKRLATKNEYAIDNIEAILESAGLAEYGLYRACRKAYVDVAELSAKVDMLADHLGLEWSTVPETSSWEQQIPLVRVVDHGLGILTDICARLDAEGIDHEKLDAALTELGVVAACLCST